jgi:hypothetical protein
MTTTPQALPTAYKCQEQHSDDVKMHLNGLEQSSKVIRMISAELLSSVHQACVNLMPKATD